MDVPATYAAVIEEDAVTNSSSKLMVLLEYNLLGS